MTKKKLIDALKIIKNECNSYIQCEKCPFGSKTGDCRIMCIPSNWTINEETNVWRALK